MEIFLKIAIVVPMSKSPPAEAAAKSREFQYPYYPITSALKMGDAVRELGGARTRVTKGLLAKHLGEEESSGAFSQQITSAKIFGVIEGFGEYSLTEVAKRYFFPMADSDKSMAMLEIFLSPNAYKELVRRFDGHKIPAKENLGNLMHRELNVPTSWKDRSAALFLNSAQFVGATDSHGILRVQAMREQTQPFDGGTIIDAAPAKVQDYAPSRDLGAARMPAMPAANSNTNTWTFSLNGKSIIVQTPAEKLEPELWQTLDGYVKLLKPQP